MNQHRLVFLTFAMTAALPGAPIAVVSYDMLNGQAHTYSYRDKIYNGTGNPLVSLSPLSGGTGLLTDGVVGADDFTTDLGNGPSYEWVGWARNSFTGDPLDLTDANPTITFHFASVTSLSTVSLFINNLHTTISGVSIFKDAIISFSTDGVSFGNTIVYSTSLAEQTDTTARFITIPLNQTARHVRINLTRFPEWNWTFLAEVQFDDGLPSGEVPEPGSLLLLGPVLVVILRLKQFR